MTYGAELTAAEVDRDLQVACRSIIRESLAAIEKALDLEDAQNGQTVLAWSRGLYQLPDTGKVSLTVDATGKRIVAPTGSLFFSGFNVGRDVQITSFANAGNNITTEITAKANDDEITIGNATGLVSETADARVRQNPTSEQQAATTARIDAINVLKDLDGFLKNGTGTVVNAIAVLRDFA